MSFSRRVEEFFRKRLGQESWQRLQEIAADYQVFEYHPSEEGFELSEALCLRMDEVESRDLDLLLHSCQVLNNEADAEIKRELAQAVPGEEEQTIYFTFEDNEIGATRNNVEVAQGFIDLLQGTPGFRYRVEEAPGEMRVAVTFVFRAEFEYQRKKEELDWLLQIARRQSGGKPFRGSRI